MYKAKLSYAQLKTYTSMLVKLNLLRITTHEKRIVYQTTEKGKSFLERFEELIPKKPSRFLSRLPFQI
jgi:predicted transcriptional regulator